MDQLTELELNALRGIDTPTVCNAIERFKIRDDTSGFVGMNIHCVYPQFAPTVGYALTVTVDSTTPMVKRDNEVWKEWVRAMDAAPKPIFLVFKDVSSTPQRSAHIGEVMATLATRMGVVGLLTDGGVRDIREVERLGMHMFAAGVVTSHGNPRLIAVNTTVELDGVTIRPGDLLHGDLNGVTSIPIECAKDLPSMAELIRLEEANLMEYIWSDDFSVDGFIAKKFSH
jgi:regulator of RNase E activity RraA